jgi:two-component system response regulator RegX3
MDSKARILVVDDNITMRESLRDTLGTEGYRVQIVENAIQGIAELERQEFELVLADLSLPA